MIGLWAYSNKYLSQDFHELLKECGIVSQLTPPGTPEWNGVSERRNRTLLDMVRSMMSHTDLPTSFWGYALETTAFTLNLVPSKSVQKTPHEMWTGNRPNINIELKEVQQQQVREPEVEETPQILEENSTDLETQPLRRSTRERHEPERYGFLVMTHGNVILVDQDEPKTYQEAVANPDSEKCLEAMRSEMDSISENQVWTLVEPPEGMKPIGCKWVFKKKTDMDGNVQTYKGRLVAKGFQQIHNVDYDETFSPVAMFKSIRILLAVAAFHDYEIWQMDVKTAFLNGKLEEDVKLLEAGIFVSTRLVYRSFSKQDTIADSTTEAKYIAASETAKEAVWIKKFITGLGVIPGISDAVDLYCDNNGAIAQAKEPISHQRSKHILRRFHLIREIIDRGDVEICKVHTDDNIADPLTKPLAQ
ncbi:hypothetical protein GQ457_06G011750 [Hibiscus cannabinus]